MLLSPSQIKAVEAAAFARGVEPEVLMEAAGSAIAQIVSQFYPNPELLFIWGGKGNNAGDALVAGRILAEIGWKVKFFGAFPETELAALPAKKLAELRKAVCSLHGASTHSLVVMDGLLGIGVQGPLRPEICAAVEEINRLRRERGAWVLSVDMPTGLDGETGEPNSPCVQADLTATIGFVKKGLVADRATASVGRLASVPLPELVFNESDVDRAELITPHLLGPWLPPRNFDSHKGTYGRVGILAGSRQFPGAARLCTHAALRAGAGYATLFVTEELQALLAGTSLPPEAIIFPIRSFQEILEHPLDALCIGPGLGAERKKEILDVVRKASMPTVIDADALNALADCRQILNECQGFRLLTPHPGEFARLAPEFSLMPRRPAAEAFVERYPCTLLLKGARTLIAEKGFPSLFNSTGNPGMGSAGMGDALTGVCGALLAQGHKPRQAASIAAWVCGRAAEIAIFSCYRQSPESLLAGDVIDSLGQAFYDLRRGVH